MDRVSLYLISMLFLLAGCNRPAPTVVLDGWHNRDFARDYCASAKKWQRENQTLIAQAGCQNVTSCEELSKVAEACVLDAAGGVAEFQIELASQFGSNPECNGVRLVQFNNPTEKNEMAAKALARYHWTLLLDFAPGSADQPWSLVGEHQVLKGKNRASEIAGRVCNVVRRRGADVFN